MSIFACCVRSYDVNKRENKFYNKFKSNMVKEYESENAEHEYNLALLFKKAFKTSEVINEENK
jgi:hypothetical protein